MYNDDSSLFFDTINSYPSFFPISPLPAIIHHESARRESKIEERLSFSGIDSRNRTLFFHSIVFGGNISLSRRNHFFYQILSLPSVDNNPSRSSFHFCHAFVFRNGRFSRPFLILNIGAEELFPGLS